MKTFFKGLAVILYIAWLAGGAVLAFGEFVAWVGDFPDTWLPSDTGWWQLLIYGAWIVLGTLSFYVTCRSVGEWVEDK